MRHVEFASTENSCWLKVTMFPANGAGVVNLFHNISTLITHKYESFRDIFWQCFVDILCLMTKKEHQRTMKVDRPVKWRNTTLYRRRLYSKKYDIKWKKISVRRNTKTKQKQNRFAAQVMGINSFRITNFWNVFNESLFGQFKKADKRLSSTDAAFDSKVIDL